MSDGLDVDFGDMHAARSQLGRTADDLEKQIASLERRVSALLEHWRGHTADRYRQDWHEWHSAANDVVSALHESVALLGESQQAYSTTEDTTTEAIARAGTGIHLNLDVT